MYKILTVLACFMFLGQNAYAHPPSNINLEYKESKEAFTLIINHRVASKRHFIKQIVIKLNGKEIHSKTFNFQNNKKIVRFSFPEPEHEKGDVFSVEVTCNRTGSVTKDFSIDRVLEQYYLEGKGQAAREASSL